ncbi:hypothetical protein MK079_01070 [Candidatus Gracilibacteria bacterium]|nr:hypothetical protein [Candidatus Gracilibacteria bacterium]
MFSKIDPDFIKYFIYKLSFRRNFIALLSIYFLTLPDTTANQIGIFSGISYLLSFFLEIPSGYLSDKIGHKKILIGGKVFQFFSVIFYITAFFLPSPWNFYSVFMGSILQTLSFTAASGTDSAFLHEILEKKGHESMYAKIHGKISAYVSLISVIFIVSLPFFTLYHILLPFIIWLIVDIFGFISLISIQYTQPDTQNHKEYKNFGQLFKESIDNKTLHVSFFLAIVIGFMVGEAAFRGVYLTELGYPISLIGMVMGASRIIWFFIGNSIHLLKGKVHLRQFFFFEIFFFSMLFLCITLGNNPYIVGSLFALAVGYQWGRKGLMEDMLLNDYIQDKRYKATFLSIQGQISNLISVFISFLLGFITSYSFKIGYMTFTLLFSICLCLSFYFIFRKKEC